MPNPKGHPQTLTAPRFQPGQSGNPGGYSRARREMLPLTGRLEVLLEKQAPKFLAAKFSELDAETKAKWGDILCLAILRKAISKHEAFRIISELVEGKPLQRLRIEGHDGGPLAVTDKNADELKDRVTSLIDEIRARARDTGRARRTRKTT